MPLKLMRIDEIKKTPKLASNLITFAKTAGGLENVMFYFDNGNMAGMHPKYIQSGAKSEVNISGKVREEMQAHFDGKQEAKWKASCEVAKSQVAVMINNDLLSRFYKSEGYVRPMLEGSLAKAAKVLGIGSAQNAELLNCLVAFYTGGEPAGKKKLGEFLKKAKIQIEVNIVAGNLKKQGLI